MAEARRLYRLTFPTEKSKGNPRAVTGVIERRLTDTQAERFRRAVEHPGARVRSIELVEEV